MQFTERNLKQLKPRGKPYRVFEGGSDPGFSVQVSKAGNVSYVLAYSFQNKRRFLKLGTLGLMPVTEARAKARAARAQLDAGIDPRVEITEKAKPKTRTASLGDLLAAYLEDCERREVKSLPHITRMFNNNIPADLLKTEAKDITPASVHFIIRPVVERDSKTLASRLRQQLRAVYQYGLRADYDINRERTTSFGLTTNPVDAIPTVKGAEKARDRVLTLPEIKTIWEQAIHNATPEGAGCLMALIASGGCRVQEITKMRWEHIDLDAGTFLIPTTKTGKPRLHPIGSHMREIIEWIRPVTGDKEVLWPGFKATSTPINFGSLAAIVRRLRERNHMEPWIAKDTRRTAATLLAEAGVERDDLMALLGHTMPGVHTRHYNLYDRLPEKQAAMTVWDDLLTKALN